MKIAASVLLVAALAGCSTEPEPAKPLPLEQQPVRTRALDQSVHDGVTFLLKSQERGGYWGTGCRPLGWDIYASAPGSHMAFKVATTALCAMALREVAASGILLDPMKSEAVAAGRRAEDWLVGPGIKVRRASQDEIYNVWGHMYGLQALAAAIRDEQDPARLESLKKGALEHLDLLDRYSTTYGGWNYYDFAYLTQHPSLEPTAFGTSAGLIALKEARAVGLPVSEKLVRGAIRLLEKCRTPENTYLYSYDWRYHPMGIINRPAGSLGRTQAGNDALTEWGSKAVPAADLTAGLERLFKLQLYLECGRKRPIPHEAYYAVAGYFYYFGHYYAARLLPLIPAEDAKIYAKKLSDTIRPHQEEDGSWWDFGMWDFHKPYGTAFALLILKRCRDAGSE
ncbi:MAG: signal peptide-domain containing [Planctomycetota bacterium]|nr:MAG: signal peptide-domain containing [Planctomycetota bacterium]